MSRFTLVSGGGTGIGLAVAYALAADGDQTPRRRPCTSEEDR